MSDVVPTPAAPLDRAYFKALGQQLILDDGVWASFYDRCRAMAAAQIFGHRNANTVAAVALKGFSLGMDFMEALSKIKLIENQPTLRGPNAVAHLLAVVPGAQIRCVTDQLRAPPREAPDKYTIVGFEDVDRLDLERRIAELSDEREDLYIFDRLDPCLISVWCMSRPGWPSQVYLFTYDQAERAGLPGKNDTWRHYPDRCLKWQAASVGVQEMFGAELSGMYLAEELDHAPARGGRQRREPAEASQEPSDAARISTPPNALSRATPSLAEIGDRLRRLGLPWSLVCRRVLRRDAENFELQADTIEAESLCAWLSTIEAQKRQIAEGRVLWDHRVRVYQTQFDQYRGVVERVTDESPVIEWSGPARNSKDQALHEAVIAALYPAVGGSWPPRGEPDRPDPEAVARAHEALAAEQRRIADQSSQDPTFPLTDATSDLEEDEEGDRTHGL
jgi:hypothetical protein